MPHISTYGGFYFSTQPEKEDFGSFEPREAKFQEASTNDELTGRKGLNWRELCDVGTSLRKSDDFIKLGDIKGDRLFTTGGGGDSLTGEGRSTKIWTNGDASTFEDRDRGATVYVDEDVDGLLKLGDIKGELQTTELRGENRFVIERFASGSAVESFEPAAGMDSFGESLNHVLEISGTAGPGATSFMTGQFEMPTDKVGNPYSAPID